jgi:DNA-binding NarL/FixJ family response regulator
MSDATTVLLIDNDPHYREYYAQRLHASSTNYDVVEAATGRSGLDICARQPIDCVVFEIDLPDISGFEVLAKLVPRAYHPEIAVIILTRLPNPFLLDSQSRTAHKSHCKRLSEAETFSHHLSSRPFLRCKCSTDS